MNEEWWRFIHPDHGLVEFRFIHPGGTVEQHWDRNRTSTAFNRLEDGVDAYYGVLPRKTRGGRAEDCWPTTTVLWADVDAKHHCQHESPHTDPGDDAWDKRDALNAILRFPLPPSAIVDSGHGYHAYWGLNGAVDFPDAQHVMRGIARWVKGDSTYDQPRILRVPGTTNWKDPANPVPVRLLKLDTLRRYDLSDFDEIVACLEDHTPPRPRVERREDAPEWLRDLINDEPPKGARSETEFKVIAWLARYGYTDDAILTVLMHSPVGAKAQERGERWALGEVARVRSKAWTS